MGLSLTSLQSRHLRAAPRGPAAAPGPPPGRSAGPGLAVWLGRVPGPPRGSGVGLGPGHGLGVGAGACPSPDPRRPRPGCRTLQPVLQVEAESGHCVVVVPGSGRPHFPGTQSPDPRPRALVRGSESTRGGGGHRQGPGMAKPWGSEGLVSPPPRLTCPLLHLQMQLGCSGGCGPDTTPPL